MRRLPLLFCLVLVLTASCSTPEPPTCDQGCQDAVALKGTVETALKLYNDNLANGTTPTIDLTAPCSRGGSVRIVGLLSVTPDETVSVDLAYTFTACAHASYDFSFTFDGALTMKGAFRNTDDGNDFVDFTFSSPTLSIAGKVLVDDIPTIAVTCPLDAVFEMQNDAWQPPYGMLCGRPVAPTTNPGAGGSSGTGGSSGSGGAGGGPGDQCAPYTGSYAGIYSFGWSCVNDPTQNGQGTINVHFTAKCSFVKPDGTLWLEIDSIMSDNQHLGALTKETCPLGCGYLAMPPNPPTTSGPDHDIYLIFPNSTILGTSGPFTITSGAAKLGSDVGNHDAFYVGEPAFTYAGKPSGDPGCVVDMKTFKIDKTQL